VKLDGLIHSKIVLVEDHVEYEKKTRKSNHSNLIRQSVSDICYGTWETVQKYVPMAFFLKSRTSKLKETIKIQYYTLSIRKTYWKYQKHNKKTN
jgi:hypothetical protein